MGVLGAILLRASFGGIDPEDEVPLAMWLAPLVLGAAATGIGIALWPRSSYQAPPGGW